MEEQIKQQFTAINENCYETIILGNSRLYRGINPELLDNNCYNFAFDNDSFLESYYKLKYLEGINKLPKRVILGVDYFEFSFVSAGMKNTYDLYFDKEYDDIISNCTNLSFGENNNFDEKINKAFNSFFVLNYYNSVSYLYYKYILHDTRVSHVSEFGQYRIFPQPKATRGDFLTRSSIVLPEQESAYLSILDFCQNMGIEIVQIMLPLRDIESNCYSEDEIDFFNEKFSSNHNVKFLNFSCMNEFDLSDFMDDTHLNLIGADKFTVILRNEINKVFFQDY